MKAHILITASKFYFIFINFGYTFAQKYCIPRKIKADKRFLSPETIYLREIQCDIIHSLRQKIVHTKSVPNWSYKEGRNDLFTIYLYLSIIYLYLSVIFLSFVCHLSFIYLLFIYIYLSIHFLSSIYQSIKPFNRYRTVKDLFPPYPVLLFSRAFLRVFFSLSVYKILVYVMYL